MDPLSMSTDLFIGRIDTTELGPSDMMDDVAAMPLTPLSSTRESSFSLSDTPFFPLPPLSGSNGGGSDDFSAFARLLPPPSPSPMPPSSSMGSAHSTSSHTQSHATASVSTHSKLTTFPMTSPMPPLPATAATVPSPSPSPSPSAAATSASASSIAAAPLHRSAYPPPAAPSRMFSVPAPSMSPPCSICFSADQSNSQLVSCSRCHVVVHRGCYGIVSASSDNWSCMVCLRGLSPSAVTCALCPTSAERFPYRLAFKVSRDGQWVHMACAYWLAQVRFADRALMIPNPVNAFISNRGAQSPTCQLCGSSYGVVVNCLAPRCRQMFHPLCARSHGFRMELHDVPHVRGQPADTPRTAVAIFCNAHTDVPFVDKIFIRRWKKAKAPNLPPPPPPSSSPPAVNTYAQQGPSPPLSYMPPSSQPPPSYAPSGSSVGRGFTQPSTPSGFASPARGNVNYGKGAYVHPQSSMTGASPARPHTGVSYPMMASQQQLPPPSPSPASGDMQSPHPSSGFSPAYRSSVNGYPGQSTHNLPMMNPASQYPSASPPRGSPPTVTTLHGKPLHCVHCGGAHRNVDCIYHPHGAPPGALVPAPLPSTGATAPPSYYPPSQAPARGSARSNYSLPPPHPQPQPQIQSQPPGPDALASQRAASPPASKFVAYTNGSQWPPSSTPVPPNASRSPAVPQNTPSATVPARSDAKLSSTPPPDSSEQLSKTSRSPSPTAISSSTAPVSTSITAKFSSSSRLSTKAESHGPGVKGQVGLQNLGNSCFFNAVLQALSNTAEFRDFFLGRYTSQHKTSGMSPSSAALRSPAAHSRLSLVRQLSWGSNPERLVRSRKSSNKSASGSKSSKSRHKRPLESSPADDGSASITPAASPESITLSDTLNSAISSTLGKDQKSSQSDVELNGVPVDNVPQQTSPSDSADSSTNSSTAVVELPPIPSSSSSLSSSLLSQVTSQGATADTSQTQIVPASVASSVQSGPFPSSASSANVDDAPLLDTISLSDEIALLFNEMWNQSPETYSLKSGGRTRNLVLNPESLFDTLTLVFPVFGGFRQHDAQECFRLLLERIEYETTTLPKKRREGLIEASAPTQTKIELVESTPSTATLSLPSPHPAAVALSPAHTIRSPISCLGKPIASPASSSSSNTAPHTSSTPQSQQISYTRPQPWNVSGTEPALASSSTGPHFSGHPQATSHSMPTVLQSQPAAMLPRPGMASSAVAVPSASVVTVSAMGMGHASAPHSNPPPSVVVYRGPTGTPAIVTSHADSAAGGGGPMGKPMSGATVSSSAFYPCGAPTSSQHCPGCCTVCCSSASRVSSGGCFPPQRSPNAHPATTNNTTAAIRVSPTAMGTQANENTPIIQQVLKKRHVAGYPEYLITYKDSTKILPVTSGPIPVQHISQPPVWVALHTIPRSQLRMIDEFEARATPANSSAPQVKTEPSSTPGTSKPSPTAVASSRLLPSVPTHSSSNPAGQATVSSVVTSSPQAFSHSAVLERSIVEETFQGVLLSEVTCTNCKYVFRKYDQFLDLSLDIPATDDKVLLTKLPEGGFAIRGLSVRDCLRHFCAQESLQRSESYRCEKCNTQADSTKRITIHKLPKILCIHLKRFRWSEDAKGKILTHVSFPMMGLNMAPYLSKVSASTPSLQLSPTSTPTPTLPAVASPSRAFPVTTPNPMTTPPHSRTQANVAPAAESLNRFPRNPSAQPRSAFSPTVNMSPSGAFKRCTCERCLAGDPGPTSSPLSNRALPYNPSSTVNPQYATANPCPPPASRAGASRTLFSESPAPNGPSPSSFPSISSVTPASSISVTMHPMQHSSSALESTPIAKLEAGVKQERPLSTRYDLTAVIRHHGSGVRSGHYTAYALNEADTKQQWLHFDDNHVYAVSADTVAGAEAYILFYRQRSN